MEVSEICGNLVRALRAHNSSVKDFREKMTEIINFCETLQKRQDIKAEFVKSEYIVEIICAIFDLSINATEKTMFQSKRFEAIPYFFEYLATNNISFAKEESEIQRIINIVRDIIGLHIPKSNNETWKFWLIVFTKLMKIPTFFNIFKLDDSETEENYADSDEFFNLINGLMKFNKLLQQDNIEIISFALDFFNEFLLQTPYPPLSDTILSFFELSDKLAVADLSDHDFITFLCILNHLISISPVSFLINATSAFSAPFNRIILKRIFEKWDIYQQNPLVRKSSSAYLLLFLTTTDSMKCKVENSFINDWSIRILNVWATVLRQDQIFESLNDIPYLRLDVEFFKRSKNESISRTLLNYILPNNKLNKNSNIFWLFSAIGQYASEVVRKEHWLLILDNVSKYEMVEVSFLNQNNLTDFYHLIYIMVDIIDSIPHWNAAFIYLSKKLPPSQLSSSHYRLISKILKCQRIDTKVAHENQSILWKGKADYSNFSLERLKCIHTLIYYYGFNNDQTRSQCFMTLMALFDSKDQFPLGYLKQLSLTICSLILPYACELVEDEIKPIESDSIEDICSRLAKTLEITISQEKMPLQTEELFCLTPESSQVTAEEEVLSFDILSYESYQSEETESIPRNTKKTSLCNFISPKMQASFVSTIRNKTIPKSENKYLLNLYLTSTLPSVFTVDKYLENFKIQFLENCTPENFSSFFHILLEMTDIINHDEFQPFFNDLSAAFFEIANQYVKNCEDKIKEHIQLSTSLSWDLLTNLAYEDFFEELPALANLALNCSKICLDAEQFYAIFEDFLSTSNWIPILHVKICSFLLKMELTEQQYGDIVVSLECITTRVLQTLLVPLKDRTQFIDELLDILIYNNSEPMNDLFKTISQLSLTPQMKISILQKIQLKYEYANEIFDCFWENNSAFFITDSYATIRLKSIDAIISILKLKELTVTDNGETRILKLNKEDFLARYILEDLNNVLDEVDWKSIKEHIFTALKTLIQIVSEIPELSIKCLMRILRLFAQHNLDVFPKQCLNVLFSGLSSRVHFSVFLRQFIPLLISELNENDLTNFPYQLFFMDDDSYSSLSKHKFNECKRMFCDQSQCYAIPYSIANQNQAMIDFYANTFNLKTNDLIKENAVYICSYLLELSNFDSFEEMFNAANKMQKDAFNSPLPLLSFVWMTSDESISNAFATILLRFKYSPSFVDIRGIIYNLYRNIFKAHHYLVQSYYLTQFLIYLSICFDNQKHQFESMPTLYSDVLSLSVNLIHLVKSNLIANLIYIIAQNIPDSFLGTKQIGFVKNIEELCLYVPTRPSVDLYLQHFPKLIDKIMIFDFLKEIQIQRRTPVMEFKRIAKTRRLNRDSIAFLLKHFIICDNEDIGPILEISNDYKRIVLSEIYKFSITDTQSSALHLYSEMFLHFIKIHPSPLIVSHNVNSMSHLFEDLILLTRDKNPSISRSALTCLYQLNHHSLIPKSIKKNENLYNQLIQYSNYNHPRKNSKKPDCNSSWICNFTYQIMEKMDENDVSHYFANLAAQSSEFAEIAFPHMFVECLNDVDDLRLYSQIMAVFNKFAAEPNVYSKECRIILASFNYLKDIWFQSKHDTPDWHLKWGDIVIDFELLMKTSLAVGDPYSAYQYAEFAYEMKNMDQAPLKSIFTQLGVSDLNNGLNDNFLDIYTIANIYEQEGKIGNALSIYDYMTNTPKRNESLGKLHLYNLLNSVESNNFDSLWKLRKWDVSPDFSQKENHSMGLFKVMQAFATNQETFINEQLNEFQQKFSFDNTMSVFNQLSCALDASALQWFQAISFPESNKLFNLFPEDTIQYYRKSLEKLNQLTKQYYDITESTNMLHAVFFTIRNKKKSLLMNKFFESVIGNARENNKIESAQYFISILHEMSDKLADFEQIQLLYQNNPQRAYSLLTQNSDRIVFGEWEVKKQSDKLFNLRIQYTKAAWSAHINYLSRKEIKHLLKDVINQSEEIEAVDLMAEAEFTLARYFHRHHQEVCDFFKSSEYTTIMKSIETGSEFMGTHTKKTEVMRANEQNTLGYESLISSKQKLFSKSIVQAIESYLKCLIHSNAYDLESTFAIIGLLFDYSYTEFKPFIQEVPDLIPTMEQYFDDIDPIKFLPLFYQLAARVDDMGEMTSTQNDDYNSSFQQFLRKMVISISQKSPKECFPILYALINNDRKIAKNPTASMMQIVNAGKINAIRDVTRSITHISDELNEMWKQTFNLLTCYIKLGETPNISKTYSKLSQFGAKYLFEITNENMPFATVVTTSKTVTISKFEDKMTFLNGVTSPILLSIRGTDGHLYRQILKANKDDLRQDAVMQQLFILSSRLLSRKNPDFSIRHYKVIPLSPAIGIIEFVENSMSIQDYLFVLNDKKPDSGAYTRYYTEGPNASMKYRDALRAFHNESMSYHKETRKKDKDLKSLINCFVDIRSKMKPVFKFFFIERFQNSGDWFVARLRYAQHSATNSIVGHILGIGDRHLNNILIDKNTGEVIHIDLGIAFDQGKVLQVMERVPFRLTNEIIDGMGWMGMEGIFRPACETSMKVLRDNQEYLLTVLKVLVSDPLYNWVLVPKKQNKDTLIRSSNENKNQFAENVIFNCKRKLEGRETGETLSVEGQVARLINDATNVENLALMYFGWKPFL